MILRAILFLFISLLSFPDIGYAWFWSSNTVKTVESEELSATNLPDAHLKVRKLNYKHDYGDTVRDIAVVDVFVICKDCPDTILARDLVIPEFALRFGQERIPPTTVTVAEAQQPSKPAQVEPAADTNQNPPAAERAVNEPKTELVLKAKTNDDPECLLSTVQFTLDDATLKTGEQQKLKDQVIGRLKDIKDAVIHVKGYTCKIGTKDYNDRLSVRRAKAVAEFLEANGVRPLKVEGEGKCCYISEDLPLNRRSEVTYINDKSLVEPTFCGPRRK